MGSGDGTEGRWRKGKGRIREGRGREKVGGRERREEMGERKGYTMELLASVNNTMKFLRLVFSFLW